MPKTIPGAIIGGGFVAGLIDIVYACVFYGALYDVAPMRIFQSVAAGWFGRDAAMSGGAQTAALGLLTHFGITIAMAAIYVIASLRAPVLRTRWLTFGLLYGAALWAAMNFVVVPLSNAPEPTFSIWPTIGGVLIHMFGVGLIIAYFASKTEQATQA